MKNLLLILLLANILYFLWGWVGHDELEPGEAIVKDADLGPPLAVAPTPDADAVASVGAVLGSDEPTRLAAVVGRSCVTIGPIRDRGEADAAETRHAAQGMHVDIRQERGRYFIGHWVQIQDAQSEQEADDIVAALREGGIPEAYRAVSEEKGIRVFLGLFSSLESAERIELQAKSLGFNPVIEPEYRDGDLFWVDVALPPGKGAGDLIARYGEEQVMLRDQATCPPAS